VRRGVALGALGAFGALAFAPGAHADLGGYCAPDSRQFDPPDVRGGTSRTLPGVSERRITAAGISAPVLEAGPHGAAEAVVFVHGNPGSSQDWLELLAHTGRFARALAIDLPGFGRAGKPRSFPYHLAGYTRFLREALERLGVARAHLVMHDIGGLAGLEWATESPAALRSAVLIDTGVLLGYEHHHFARIWRTPEVGESTQASVTRETFHEAVQSGGSPRRLPRDFVDRMYDDYDRFTRCAVLDLYRSADDPSGIGVRHARVLRPLRRPALVIWGRHDPYLPAPMAYRQREAFPDAAVHMFEDSGHWPFVDDRARADALVLPFLRSQTTQRPSLVVRVRRPRARSARRFRRLRVRVAVRGADIAAATRVRLYRRGRRAPVASTPRPVAVRRRRTFRLRLHRGLRPGRYTVTARSPAAAPGRATFRVPRGR
jgi:pimeloyl-ACP methyl ester carboxylesterase